MSLDGPRRTAPSGRPSVGRSADRPCHRDRISPRAIGAANPGPASAAAGIKVVVIVGPVESSTSNYITSAKRYAAQARSYGATVVEIYSPNATWSRVKAAAQGAKVVIYLGHGNGSPSPYGAFSKYTKDGFGLNATAGNGNSNTKYYGEYYVRTGIKLAPNAVVILNRLCYASGNSEWGRPNPTKTVAKQRVDNYGAGFLRAGARAVFADGITCVVVRPVRPVPVESVDRRRSSRARRTSSGRTTSSSPRRGRPATRPGWPRSRTDATTARWSATSA